jgi:hypothetical protein
MICGEFDFFKAACTSEWMEQGKNMVTLVGEDPVIFGFFSSWIYTGKIHESEDFINIIAETLGLNDFWGFDVVFRFGTWTYKFLV